MFAYLWITLKKLFQTTPLLKNTGSQSFVVFCIHSDPVALTKRSRGLIGEILKAYHKRGIEMGSWWTRQSLVASPRHSRNWPWTHLEKIWLSDKIIPQCFLFTKVIVHHHGLIKQCDVGSRSLSWWLIPDWPVLSDCSCGAWWITSPKNKII